MIKKLKTRIFLLIIISLLVVVLGVIMLFGILNYKNTINTATMMMERFNGGIHKSINDIPKDKQVYNNYYVEGLYSFLIKNNEIINSNVSCDISIQEYAIKLSNKNKETGIIGNYIYKVRKIEENTYNITLMENEKVIWQIKVIFISLGIISIIAIIIIYIIARKLSELIVKPVQETFEQQKQFVSDASHELKTPLAVIEANADVLENEIGNNKWLKYIQSETESMDKLINELLLLSKIENIDNANERTEFDVSKETQIIISMFESMAYEKNIKLISNIQNDVKANGNKEDLNHILSTLLDNAIKHTESEKEIIVQLDKEKNDIILQVKNMGEQIPESEREKIFERFYRIDKARNRNEKRYGLGLAIAKSTVEKYNGKIEVLYKDGFTIFKVIMPI